MTKLGKWCQTVVLQPIIDTFSLRFGREHCNAARLGPRRRAITQDAGCTLYIRERKENEGLAQAYHSRRESLMTSSSRDLEVSGKLDAVFSCHSESSRNTFSKRDRSNEPGNRFESSVHSVVRFADPVNVGNHFLMETRIICLIKQGLNL